VSILPSSRKGVGAIGKKVDTVTIRGWSLDKPSEDGATFELTWNN